MATTSVIVHICYWLALYARPHIPPILFFSELAAPSSSAPLSHPSKQSNPWRPKIPALLCTTALLHPDPNLAALVPPYSLPLSPLLFSSLRKAIQQRLTLSKPSHSTSSRKQAAKPQGQLTVSSPMRL
ncbi:hypothetical protein SEVIR_5G299500v4 [Setaria viridis]|uniref:Uncharacterized protein n=1 Tax=Setaria viridis TaxID=4556 RepID=A0A4U6UPS5_SETVI|nr:hypothetical protein SEVIR_5G299500v2 [Setaria viridis]